jgi:transposase
MSMVGCACVTGGLIRRFVAERSNWEALGRYPDHGELSIDNNRAERMLRAQALGRRNWTFLGSDRVDPGRR